MLQADNDKEREIELRKSTEIRVKKELKEVMKEELKELESAHVLLVQKVRKEAKEKAKEKETRTKVIERERNELKAERDTLLHTLERERERLERQEKHRETEMERKKTIRMRAEKEKAREFDEVSNQLKKVIQKSTKDKEQWKQHQSMLLKEHQKVVFELEQRVLEEQSSKVALGEGESELEQERNEMKILITRLQNELEDSERTLSTMRDTMSAMFDDQKREEEETRIACVELVFGRVRSCPSFIALSFC